MKIELPDRDVFPENLTSTSRGDVIIGSLGQHYIYRARPGERTARRWIDLTGFQSISYGVLADEDRETLWACTIVNSKTGVRPPPLDERHSTLRAFNLRSGRPTGTWPLPGQSNSCNDMTIAPDGSVLVSDIGNSRILKLDRASGEFEVFYAGPETARVDGLAFLEGALYFTNLDAGELYRLPSSTSVSSRRPVRLTLSQPLGRPDGMRAYDGRLYIADNKLNQVIEVTISGDSAAIIVLADGFENSCGVAPRGQWVWVAESKSHVWSDNPASDPNPFAVRRIARHRNSMSGS